MNIITIDGIEYDLTTLSPDAVAHIQSVQFVDSEIMRLQAMIAALQTSRVAYANALKGLLNPLSELGEVITFN